MQFSKDYGSSYPDIGTGELQPNIIKPSFPTPDSGRMITDERIFSCPGSKFFSDGEIGAAPEFKQALEPGECHWEMLKDQTATSVGNMPIIFENALTGPSWPPKRDVSVASSSPSLRIFPQASSPPVGGFVYAGSSWTQQREGDHQRRGTHLPQHSPRHGCQVTECRRSRRT